ncbi:arsenic resistance N-acetyltransferase ArsN2 [Dokdonella immobilis]|nr:arsenic resistance N-acetyltransferase ArsN2 [Dokdonella immobilis]
MSGALLLEDLGPAGMAGLRAALSSEGLPHEDIDAEDCRFYRARLDDTVAGYVGLQGNGIHRLLRSMWVQPERRREGMGAALLDAIEYRAAAEGCRTLHLLTTTANAFFTRHGFRPAERNDAPASIASTREFAALCPASATYLTKRIANPS